MARPVAHKVALSMCTYFFSRSPAFLMPLRISIARDCGRREVRVRVRVRLGLG